MAARTLTQASGGRSQSAGCQGGELRRPFDADSTSVWHAWWDGWAGPGLGNADPGLARSAGTRRALLDHGQHLPGDAGDNPAGRTIALGMVIAALPLAFLSAYLSAHVVTPARWPRAARRRHWALSPAAIAALAAGGRLGGLAILVLLPLMLAAVITHDPRPTARPGSLVAGRLDHDRPGSHRPRDPCARRGGRARLWCSPACRARRRALGYLAVLALAAIPIVLLAARHAGRAARGLGARRARGPRRPPGQLALGQPDLDPVDGTALGALTDYRAVWLGAGIPLAGLVGLARPRRRGGLSAAARDPRPGGVGVAARGPAPAPRCRPRGGVTVHPWPGGGLLLMTIGLLGAALLAADGDDPPGLDTETGAETEPPRRAVRTWRVGAGALAAIGLAVAHLA